MEETNNNYIGYKSLIFFNVITSIFPVVLIGFPVINKNFKNSSWFILILLAMVVFLVFLFFKGFNKNFNAIKYTQKNTLLRVLISTYLIIMISFINISACFIIKKFFYTPNSIFLLGLINLFVSLIISNTQTKKIITSSLIFLIIILLFYLVPFFSSSNRNYYFLLPLKIDISNLSKILLITIIPLESILMIIFNNQTKKGIKTKHIITSAILIIISLLLITIDTITLLSPNFLETLSYSSFYRWNFISGNLIIQNFDILVFLILIITLIYRLSYYLKIFKIINLIKQKTTSNLIIYFVFAIIIYILYISTNHLSFFFNILVYFLFFIIFLIFSIFSFKSMEEVNEKQD